MACYIGLSVRRASVFDEESLSALKNNERDAMVRDVIEEEQEEEERAEESQRELNPITRLNVGGTIFETYKSTLKNIPGSKLSNLTEESKYYISERKEYFFDRNPQLFNFILDCYRHSEKEGNLNHISRNICPYQIKRELYYWGLDEDIIAKCCRKYFLDAMDEIETQNMLLNEFQGLSSKIYDVHTTKSDIEDAVTVRDKIWLILDDPTSGKLAMIWAIVYMVLTIFTVLASFLQAHPQLRYDIPDSLPDTENGTVHDHSPTLNKLRTSRPYQFLNIIDICCMLFFTGEFFLRFGVCKRRLRLLLTPMCIFDILYLIPVWTIYIVMFIDPMIWHQQDKMKVFLFLETCKVFRVLRIFRFFHFYKGLKILTLALKASVRELLLLVVFLSIAVTMYGSLIYYTELYVESPINTPFMGLWWALITMTTVGYGDTYPQTTFGYFVGTFCAMTGIIGVGMTVPIIASYFHSYYGLRLPDAKEKRGRRVPKPKKVNNTKVKPV